MFADGSREMFATLLQSVLICTVTYSLWRYFRQAFVKSPLDNIPGPPSPSWMTGECQFAQSRAAPPSLGCLVMFAPHTRSPL